MSIALLLAALLAAASLEDVTLNDNRQTAGVLTNDTLTVRLEVRRVMWHPEGKLRRGMEVYAFAEVGRNAMIPAPLLRVVEGTSLRIVIRNPLNVELVVYGLQSRPAEAWDSIRVPPGGTRAVNFSAGMRGTYYYWATTSDSADPLQEGPFSARFGPDSQLTGAFIVDPPNATSTPTDRVFVLSHWAERLPGRAYFFGNNRGMVVNGRSWPDTERLNYAVGDTVRWHLVSTSSELHPMHLHGFYFNVNSRGNGLRHERFAATQEPHVVTELMLEGETRHITWVPARPGNWLFHCHHTLHFLPSKHLRDAGTDTAQSHQHDAMSDMGGLVVGIHVRDRQTQNRTAPSNPRALRIIAMQQDSGDNPRLAYVLNAPNAPEPATLPAASSTLVLERDQPVAITIVNRMREATAVHWHGIELESFFDGVPGFSGGPTQITPMIAPGDSFVARFTPPRAGTFMYHTHADEIRQQPAGLTGAIVVLPPEERWDPEHDRVLVVASGHTGSGLLVTGARSTEPMPALKRGVTYRFRIMNITYNRPGLYMSLADDSGVLVWRGVAKDGADFPLDRRVVTKADMQISIGETYDFEFTPQVMGEVRFEVWNAVHTNRIYVAAMKVEE